MIGFSLMLGCLGSNYFPLQREIMVRHQPNTKIHICIHVGAHRYYVKNNLKENQGHWEAPLNISKSYMFKHWGRFQITKVNIIHKSCLPSKLLCNNTNSSVQFLKLYYVSSRKMLTATLMSFLLKEVYKTDKSSIIASWFAYLGVLSRKMEIKTF